MKGPISDFITRVAWLSFLVAFSASAALAADKLDFSGKYSLHGQKSADGPGHDVTLVVVQNEDGIEVTRLEQGKSTRNRYPLGGSEADYVSPGGVSGKCKAQLKGKYLILESVVASRPQASSPPVRVHTKEQWQLSNDGGALTIKSTVDFPDFPADISGLVGGGASGTEKFKRSSNP